MKAIPTGTAPRMAGVALALLLIAGCAASNTTAKLPTKGASARKTPAQNAELPYQFEIDGFDVKVLSAELTPMASAWDQTVNESIGEDERWLGLNVSITETQGRERQFPWLMMVRLKTALDDIVNAPHVLSARGAVNTAQEKLSPNERKEMRFFFRVKRGDFPVTLVFADGGAAPLGQ